ncbi:penicillin-binding protein 2, partial [Patescibacteria group bacterium]
LLPQRILQGFFLFSLILILILFSKTFQLQVVKGQDLLSQAEENKFIIYSIKAERGVIYDRNLNQLVFNQPAFDLICEKRDLPQEKDEILKEVSEIINKNFEELKEEIELSDSSQVLVSENLSHQSLILLEAKINSQKLPGFQIENKTVRDYKEGSSFAHLLGYIGKIRKEELKADSENYSIFDYVGRDGLEKSYEKILRKNPGKLRVQVDALGNLVSRETVFLPESGKSLVLWLDSELQKEIIKSLERTLQATGAKQGVAVALDLKTGGVMALVSLPGFDNNIFQQGDTKTIESLLADPQKSLFNRAISGTYPTGSTIKPLTASGALEEKIIEPEKKINCQGIITVPHQYDPEIIYDYEDWKTHGWTDMRKAIAESCNVYFYTIGGGYGNQEGLGPSRIKKYLELFGWGNKTQIDLPGEAQGLVSDPAWKKAFKGEDWWDGDTYLLSIGQGDILITPLQVANSFSAIANGGTLFKPKVVQKILDKDKNLIEEIKSEVLRENFIDPESLQVIREGMREAVVYGSSAILNNLPVKAAAKTGTAQSTKPNLYHNWVTVFAPYDDPQIVLTVLIENVTGVQAAALPVARDVLYWYFTQENNF